MNPTNHELAVALKEMSERAGIALGDALVLRLAAEQLREDLCDDPDDDGWIEWDAKRGVSYYPVGLNVGTPIDVKLRNGRTYIDDGDDVTAYVWAEVGQRSVTHYRPSRK